KRENQRAFFCPLGLPRNIRMNRLYSKCRQYDHQRQKCRPRQTVAHTKKKCDRRHNENCDRNREENLAPSIRTVSSVWRLSNCRVRENRKQRQKKRIQHQILRGRSLDSERDSGMKRIRETTKWNEE